MAVTGWWVESPGLFGNFDAAFGVDVSPQFGFLAGEKYPSGFGLSVPPSVGFAGAEKYAYSFGLDVTPTLGFAGTGTDGLILVGVDAADASTVTIPTHQAGDLIVMFAYSVSNTIPTAPSAGGTVPTWTSLDTGTGDGNASRTASAVASGSTTTSGTWTNGNSLCVVVLRNAAVGAHAETGGSVGTAPAAGTYTSPSITPTVTDGTAVQLYFYGGENSASWSTAPAGFTRQTSTSDVCLNTKNDTTTDGATAQTAPLVTGQGNFRSAVVEVVLA